MVMKNSVPYSAKIPAYQHLGTPGPPGPPIPNGRSANGSGAHLPRILRAPSLFLVRWSGCISNNTAWLHRPAFTWNIPAPTPRSSRPTWHARFWQGPRAFGTVYCPRYGNLIPEGFYASISRWLPRKSSYEWRLACTDTRGRQLSLISLTLCQSLYTWRLHNSSRSIYHHDIQPSDDLSTSCLFFLQNQRGRIAARSGPALA
ncbi:hypothetical protein BO71DRAFT_480615 [Aspergillus ellipticus CBS 707.79]|uniref:Uncharacterized protein n=1 Tax=Aspergillus ellipticus CBS 707.79 TaxID=1448320 RepID=A0A319DKM1_9EURO|nr:hypothetical protein BO71DRAFT_480615 [Aspergillus ellipticus CBS 707.79]